MRFLRIIYDRQVDSCKVASNDSGKCGDDDAPAADGVDADAEEDEDDEDDDDDEEEEEEEVQPKVFIHRSYPPI